MQLPSPKIMNGPREYLRIRPVVFPRPALVGEVQRIARFGNHILCSATNAAGYTLELPNVRRSDVSAEEHCVLFENDDAIPKAFGRRNRAGRLQERNIPALSGCIRRPICVIAERRPEP